MGSDLSLEKSEVIALLLILGFQSINQTPQEHIELSGSSIRGTSSIFPYLVLEGSLLILLFYDNNTAPPGTGKENDNCEETISLQASCSKYGHRQKKSTT